MRQKRECPPPPSPLPLFEGGMSCRVSTPPSYPVTCMGTHIISTFSLSLPSLVALFTTTIFLLPLPHFSSSLFLPVQSPSLLYSGPDDRPEAKEEGKKSHVSIRGQPATKGIKREEKTAVATYLRIWKNRHLPKSEKATSEGGERRRKKFYISFFPLQVESAARELARLRTVR